MHGLYRLNSKDKEITELKVAVTKSQIAETSHNQEISNLKKMAEGKAKLRRKEVEKLQTAVEEAKSDLKSEEELHNAAVSSLHAKFD